jgi:hypothetical protein
MQIFNYRYKLKKKKFKWLFNLVLKGINISEIYLKFFLNFKKIGLRKKFSQNRNFKLENRYLN